MSIKAAYIQSEIIDQFVHDESERPWIIGFSGGKDSTMLLQMVWYALHKLPKHERLRRDIYVVCNNTLVENPKVQAFTDNVLEKIEEASVMQEMGIKVIRTKPILEDSFWVNLIGRGYPAPNNMFRWCTERLKINPTTKFITEKVSESGEVIILLGTRSAESSNRARQIKKYERTGERLRKHILPNAYVYAPIKDLTTNEVWQYLQQVKSPWGASNKKLAALYKNANSGDCPLVIDKTTPSCGQSRFGCWVCTVVKKDKSMSGMIQNGEEWMLPLAELRDLLVDHRNDPEWRMNVRRNGQQSENGGPYYPHKRALVLKTLLEAQKEIQQYDPTMQLISYQELVAIQVIWYRDSIFSQSVADIYNNVFEKHLEMAQYENQFAEENNLLEEACGPHPENAQLIQELLAIQRTKLLLKRKRGLTEELEHRIEEYLKKKAS